MIDRIMELPCSVCGTSAMYAKTFHRYTPPNGTREFRFCTRCALALCQRKALQMSCEANWGKAEAKKEEVAIQAVEDAEEGGDEKTIESEAVVLRRKLLKRRYVLMDACATMQSVQSVLSGHANEHKSVQAGLNEALSMLRDGLAAVEKALGDKA